MTPARPAVFRPDAVRRLEAGADAAVEGITFAPQRRARWCWLLALLLLAILAGFVVLAARSGAWGPAAVGLGR